MFRRVKTVSREDVMRSITAENPIQHLPLPGIPGIDPDRSMGHGFNIVKMIEEHAPVRIKAIEDELEQLNRKHAELSIERIQLQKLLDAVK